MYGYSYCDSQKIARIRSRTEYADNQYERRKLTNNSFMYINLKMNDEGSTEASEAIISGKNRETKL